MAMWVALLFILVNTDMDTMNIFRCLLCCFHIVHIPGATYIYLKNYYQYFCLNFRKRMGKVAGSTRESLNLGGTITDTENALVAAVSPMNMKFGNLDQFILICS